MPRNRGLAFQVATLLLTVCLSNVCVPNTALSAGRQQCDSAALRKELSAVLVNCPGKTLKMTIGYNPGGNTYMLGNGFLAYLHKIAERDAFNVILEPRPGASGEIASRLIAELSQKSSACQILIGQSNQFTTNFIGVPNPIDPIKDLVPIAMLGESPLVLVVNPKTTPHRSFGEWADYLKADFSPNRKDFFGSNGNYATDHLATESLLQQMGVRGTHVPFTGSGPFILNLLATTQGQISFGLLSLGLIKEQLVDGKLQALAIAQNQDLTIPRNLEPALVIPAISKFVPGYSGASIWVALAGSRFIPNRLKFALAEAAECFSRDAEMRSIYVDEMMFQLGGTADDVSERMANETKEALRIFPKVKGGKNGY